MLYCNIYINLLTLTHPGSTTNTFINWNKDIIGKDILQIVKNMYLTCAECQLAKGAKKHRLGLLQPLRAKYHNHLVHFDFFGPIHGGLSVINHC